MKIVAFISEKGGSGKSTLATAYAATAAQAGETVLILDVDAQASAVSWSKRREADNPSVLGVPPGRLRQAVEAAQAGGADLIVIDTPGKNANIATNAAKLADLVLIPCRPLIFDMDSLPSIRAIVQAADNVPAFIVYNAVHPQGHNQVEKIKELTQAAYHLPPCPVHISQRAIFPDAQARGLGPSEIDKDSRATAELQDLYLFVATKTLKGKKHGKQKLGSA